MCPTIEPTFKTRHSIGEVMHGIVAPVTTAEVVKVVTVVVNQYKAKGPSRVLGDMRCSMAAILVRTVATKTMSLRAAQQTPAPSRALSVVSVARDSDVWCDLGKLRLCVVERSTGCD
jgi:hypothetical protein